MYGYAFAGMAAFVYFIVDASRRLLQGIVHGDGVFGERLQISGTRTDGKEAVGTARVRVRSPACDECSDRLRGAHRFEHLADRVVIGECLTRPRGITSTDSHEQRYPGERKPVDEIAHGLVRADESQHVRGLRPKRSVERENDLVQQPEPEPFDGLALCLRKRRVEGDRFGLEHSERDGHNRTIGGDRARRRLEYHARGIVSDARDRGTESNGEAARKVLR